MQRAQGQGSHVAQRRTQKVHRALSAQDSSSVGRLLRRCCAGVHCWPNAGSLCLLQCHCARWTAGVRHGGCAGSAHLRRCWVLECLLMQRLLSIGCSHALQLPLHASQHEAKHRLQQGEARREKGGGGGGGQRGVSGLGRDSPTRCTHTSTASRPWAAGGRRAATVAGLWAWGKQAVQGNQGVALAAEQAGAARHRVPPPAAPCARLARLAGARRWRSLLAASGGCQRGGRSRTCTKSRRRLCIRRCRDSSARRVDTVSCTTHLRGGAHPRMHGRPTASGLAVAASVLSHSTCPFSCLATF